MINQIHVDECHSTQDLLKEQLNTSDGSQTYLISCDSQIAGHGRGGKTWTYQAGSLCFSFNISPHKVMSFTALEVSLLIARYFETKNRQTTLKWPNDIWNEDQKKCAGILVHGKDGVMLAGVGINIFSTLKEFGGIFPDALPFNPRELAKEIVVYILNNRYDNTEKLKKDWIDRCSHLGRIVSITEGSEETIGIFLGLGEFGEARVETSEKIVNLFNGSLRLP